MTKKKILIIDDEVNFTQLFKLNLEGVGEYEVRTENISCNGLSTIREFMPDLIFLDVVMPDLEGPDLLNQIRRNDFLQRIPVVFLTGTVTPEEVQSQHGLIGGHLFVAKYCPVHEIVNCIQKSLASSPNI